MGAEKVRSTMNRELGRFLYSARKQSRQTVGQIAASLGISESKLKSMEDRPAEVPCCELYRLFKHYGPAQMHQAQLVLIEVQASLFSASRKKGSALDSWKWELPESLIAGFLIWEALKQTFRTLVGGRFG